jgi:hypothetical protein
VVDHRPQRVLDRVVGADRDRLAVALAELAGLALPTAASREDR